MKRTVLMLAFALCSALAGAQELSVSTNLGGLAVGTANVEAAYGFARHWSVNAGAKYNPFTFGKGEDAVLMRQRALSAGARWWPWHIYSGWWMGAGLQYQEFAEGGLTGPETTEGDRFGGSFSAGYSAMLGKHFNLDFGLGVWGGYSVYTTYACQTCGRRTLSGSRSFLLPTDLILSLCYIF